MAAADSVRWTISGEMDQVTLLGASYFYFLIILFANIKVFLKRILTSV